MSDKINKIKGQAIPLRGNDIDTDRIIPARFMKCLTFDGLGQFAFYDERFEDDGSEKDHPLNAAVYNNHSILVSNRNFGCGSSREHAPWALKGLGIKCVIAQSFAEIFAGNCSSLGMAAIIVSEETCLEIQSEVEGHPDVILEVDLVGGVINLSGKSLDFTMPETYRSALVEGKWDTTSILMENLSKIRAKHESLSQLKQIKI